MQSNDMPDVIYACSAFDPESNLSILSADFDKSVWFDHEYIRADLVPQWQDISTAPRDGTEILVYRPLAHLTNDPNIKISKSTQKPQFCWQETIPDGLPRDSMHYTQGCCYPTHWHPLPAPPVKD